MPDELPPDDEEKPLSDEELREIHRFFQDLALKAYPNPERIGCPGREILAEIARCEPPSVHPAYEEHVSRCSPCLAEMLDIQGQIIAEEERKAEERKQKSDTSEP
jgi:hypothetical protein